MSPGIVFYTNQEEKADDTSVIKSNSPERDNLIEKVSLNKKVEEDGVKEARKEEVKERLTTQKKFDDLRLHSQRILFQAKSVFPFDLFPDIIIIDPTQVHIIFKQFFTSYRVHSINIHNIANVFVDTNLFFGTLKMIDRNFIENEITVKFLKRDEALKIKRIIEGLSVSAREGINFSQIEDAQLVEKLEDIGSPQTNTPV